MQCNAPPANSTSHCPAAPQWPSQLLCYRTQAVLQSICCNRLLLGIRCVDRSLAHTASLFSSPEHAPDVRWYLYHMPSASRVSRSIKFAHTSSHDQGNELGSPTSTAPTDFLLTPISPSSSSVTSPLSPARPSSSFSRELSDSRV